MYNDVKKLGFGLMRLPKTADGNEDFEKVCEMADYAIENGYKYFDTAYVYDNGLSEKCVKEVLTKRHARDEFYVATKLPSWEMKCKEDCQRIFDEQLSRTGLGYFDFYLLHALGKDSLPLLDKYGAWEFCENKKREGAIKKLRLLFPRHRRSSRRDTHGAPERRFRSAAAQLSRLGERKSSVEKMLRNGAGTR